MISPMPMLQTPIDAEAGVGTNGGRRPTVVAAPASASPELSSDRPRRRRFTVEDKLRILSETDRATVTGGIGAILRREGLYSSALTDWRSSALVPGKRCPKPTEPNPLATELAVVRRDNARLTLRLARTETIIDIQKKLRRCWASPWRPATASLDRGRRHVPAGQWHDRRGLCRVGGLTCQRAARARQVSCSAGSVPPAPEAGPGTGRPATAGRAGSVACAALRRPGTGRDLRHAAR